MPSHTPADENDRWGLSIIRERLLSGEMSPGYEQQILYSLRLLRSDHPDDEPDCGECVPCLARAIMREYEATLEQEGVQ